MACSLARTGHLLPEATCAALFYRVHWLGGVRCPYCGSSEVSVKDPQYRKYWHRYTCHPCSQKRGREVTFTDLHGTIMEGSHLDVRYWLWAWWLWVSGESISRIHKELKVNPSPGSGQAARQRNGWCGCSPGQDGQLSYFTLRFRLLLSGPVETDEAYIIAGHKGHAGGLPLKRPPRRRGLPVPADRPGKKVGRGTAQTDKVPVLGLVDRKGAVYLIPLPNVQRNLLPCQPLEKTRAGGERAPNRGCERLISAQWGAPMGYWLYLAPLNSQTHSAEPFPQIWS